MRARARVQVSRPIDTDAVVLKLLRICAPSAAARAEAAAEVSLFEAAAAGSGAAAAAASGALNCRCLWCAGQPGQLCVASEFACLCIVEICCWVRCWQAVVGAGVPRVRGARDSRGVILVIFGWVGVGCGTLERA